MGNRNLIVYGAGCTWWGSKSGVATRGDNHLPCCPQCGSMLFEIEENLWNAGVKAYSENKNNAHASYYERMMEFGRGRFYKSLEDLKGAFAEYRLEYGEVI